MNCEIESFIHIKSKDKQIWNPEKESKVQGRTKLNAIYPKATRITSPGR